MIDLKNRFQGQYPKVLFVCSAGMLRSATGAHLMATKGWNTRCVGVHQGAVQEATRRVCDWADTIICMEGEHKKALIDKGYIELTDPRVVYLGIPDQYAYRDKELESFILIRLREMGLWENPGTIIKEKSEQDY